MKFERQKGIVPSIFVTMATTLALACGEAPTERMETAASGQGGKSDAADESSTGGASPSSSTGAGGAESSGAIDTGNDLPPLPDGHVLFSAAETKHGVLGFGAHVWVGDQEAEVVVEGLELDFLRMAAGPEWPRLQAQPPLGADHTQMDAYVEANFNGDFASRTDNVTWTWEMATRHGAQVILVQFDPPPVFKTTGWLGDTMLDDARVHDFARLWGSVLQYLDSRGMRPYAVELSNEPNGEHNLKIQPGTYNELVKSARREFDERGFGDVGIIGPGLAFVDKYTYYPLDASSRDWVQALDATAMEGLFGWSMHAWDEGLSPAVDLTYLRERWQAFSQATEPKDPQRLKPIFLTEYAVVGTEFLGQGYGHPQKGEPNPASDSTIFGVRSYENTLLYTAMGPAVPIYWQAGDQGFNSQRWGLIRGDDVGNTERPAFTTLKTLMPEITDGAKVLRQLTFDDTLTVTAYVHEGRLVVGIANATATAVTRTVTIDGFAPFISNKAVAVVDLIRTDGTVQVQRGANRRQAIEVDVPAVSTLTLVLDSP